MEVLKEESPGHEQVSWGFATGLKDALQVMLGEDFELGYCRRLAEKPHYNRMMPYSTFCVFLVRTFVLRYMSTLGV